MNKRSAFIQGHSFLFVLIGTLSGLLVSVSLLPPEVGMTQSSLSFEHYIIDSEGPYGLWQKTVGDLNGDGRIDLIAGGVNGGGLVWYENPIWSKHIITSEGSFSTDAEVYDIDKDGDNDLISLTTSEIIWYENPTWTGHTIDSRGLHDLEIADFDDDGDVDVVTRNQGAFGARGDELHFYRQDSLTSWSHRAVSIMVDGEGLKVADLDGDDDQDVVAGTSWFENTKDILNGPWTEYIFTSDWIHPHTFVSTGDVNGDGRVDIALSPSELEGQTYRVSWFEAPPNPKSGNWTEHIVEDNVEAVHHFVGIADMDNDGNKDVVTAEMVHGRDPDEIKVYINQDGSGQSLEKQVIDTTGSHSMRVVDVDNDGDMDLYGANYQHREVELWENLICPPCGPAPPVISSVTAIPSDTSATITWNTDKLATSQVTYGISPNLTTSTNKTADLVISHSVLLKDLAPETTYYYRVFSEDAQGNQAMSQVLNFTTLAPGPPVISSVKAVPLDTSAAITWNTDKLATSQVTYGISPTLPMSTAKTADLVASHSVWLKDLVPETTYYYRVFSENARGNQAMSEVLNFTTLAAADVSEIYMPFVGYDKESINANVSSCPNKR